MKRHSEIFSLLIDGLNALQIRLAADLNATAVSGFRRWQRSVGADGGLRDILRPIYSFDADGTGSEQLPRELVSTIDLYEFLLHSFHEHVRNQADMREAALEFQKAFSRAPLDTQRRELILRFSAQLGSTPRQLRQDSQAFERWFGYDAINERYHRRYAESEQWQEFVLRHLGRLSARLLNATDDSETRLAIWQHLGLNEIYEPLCESAPNFRVLVALHDALLSAANVLINVPPESVLLEANVMIATRMTLETRANVWVQSAALALVAKVMPEDFANIATLRLTRPLEGDDLFVRRRIVLLLGEHYAVIPKWEPLLLTAASDTAPYVRQAVATIFASCPQSDDVLQAMHHLIISDPEPCVRAAALVAAAANAHVDEAGECFDQLLHDILTNEGSVFVVRTALHVAPEWIDRLVRLGGPHGVRRANTCGPGLLERIHRLQESAESLPVRRWAARSAERIRVALDPEAAALKDSLQQTLGRCDSHRTTRLPRNFFRQYDDATVGRVLAVLAQEDFGFDIEQGWLSPVVRRGSQFRFRLWRLWHEWQHPSPDKRQAFRHTIGRVSYANLRVPSGVLGELSPTKVPGEPLCMSDDQTWRPFLPLVDDALSALNQWFTIRPVKFFTAEGITSLTPPRSALRRISAWMRLTFAFPAYAALRNWTASSSDDPQGYVDALRQLGFTVEFRPYFSESGVPVAIDDSVLRFFAKVSGSVSPESSARMSQKESSLVESLIDAPAEERTADLTPMTHGALVPVVAAAGLVDSALRSFGEYADYFMSVYANTVPHLLIFVATVFGFFFLRQLWLTRKVRRARGSLCLSVGGWGTRGKSGTERLKAAVFNALGCGLVSKSTGCEAMFLHGSTYGELRELMLYRPYDKATIWEHTNVMRLAEQLGVPVFLWECMGLNPEYVNVLQQQWSQDDLSTITNAYPDHEDIQGPAGINVAESISSFIPPRSTLLTTEYQMRPVLLHQAQRMGTKTHVAGWLESGLITPDVLARFPYSEHPDNIALVLMMSRELGCPQDFTLKEMADRLVPDLGVLKTYPVSRVRTRQLEFSNGMSANERHGCLNNWTRLGFDKHDPLQEPGTWITTVVNNRADRIARSRVFASVLVNDLQADRHFLIGGNLKGLCGYIREAWDERAAAISLLPRDAANPNHFAVAVLRKMARQLRVPTEESQVRQMLEAMLQGIAATFATPSSEDLIARLIPLWDQPDQIGNALADCSVDTALIKELKTQLEKRLQHWNEFKEFSDRLLSTAPEVLLEDAAEFDAEFRSLLWTWFESKLVVVEDYYATGEQIINVIASHTPPGFLNRIMGVQNIKGTGLDFVYRWLAWQSCHDACIRLQTSEYEEFRRALRQLSEFREFGLLSEDLVRRTLQEARQSPPAKREDTQATLEMIQANFAAELQRVCQELRGSELKSGKLDALYRILEQIMDSSDAVRRRKSADQIYRDLAAERISTDLAVLELRKLTQRQKGGWLGHTADV